jgi:hypothetical protein
LFYYFSLGVITTTPKEATILEAEGIVCLELEMAGMAEEGRG